MVKRISARRGHQGQGAHPTGALAEDGDISGITTEGRNIAPNPLQGGDLVHQPIIAHHFIGLGGFGERRVSEIAHRTQAVIDRDQDDTVPGEIASVIYPAGAHSVGAPMDPDHDRGGLGGGGGVDIELQAVLTHSAIGTAGVWRSVGLHGLKTRRADGEGVPYAGPGRSPGWGCPAQGSHRRRGKGYVAEDRNPIGALTRQHARLDLDLGGVGLGCRA